MKPKPTTPDKEKGKKKSIVKETSQTQSILNMKRQKLSNQNQIEVENKAFVKQRSNAQSNNRLMS